MHGNSRFPSMIYFLFQTAFRKSVPVFYNLLIYLLKFCCVVWQTLFFFGLRFPQCFSSLSGNRRNMTRPDLTASIEPLLFRLLLCISQFPSINKRLVFTLCISLLNCSIAFCIECWKLEKNARVW